MKIAAAITVFLFLIAGTASAEDLDDYDYQVDPFLSGDVDPPQFLSAREEFSVEVGGEIIFPCHVQHLGNKQLVFMFNSFTTPIEEHLYFAGNTVISRNRRLVKQEQSFRLNNIRRSDAGVYTCKLYDPSVQVVHILRVQYPAKIRRLSPERQHVVKGASVTLQCEAEGNPEPAIHWSRRGGRLPSGSHSEKQGLSITLQSVDRHESGEYVCTASNGIGEPASSKMTIEVEYKPEIITEESILHTGDGDQAKLVCIVHGHPKPVVNWMRGGHLVASSKHLMTHDGDHRHSLIIKQVNKDDFGEYTCSARNQQGSTESTLMLTGRPKIPRLTSSPSGGEKDTYTLTWETESFSPIVQYRVQYRQQRHHQNPNSGSQWNVRLYIAVNPSKHSQQRSSDRVRVMAHAIRQLQPATDYQAMVSVENKFGWSNASEILTFHTQKEVAVGQSASSGSNVVLSASVLSAMFLSLVSFLINI